jgi:hypothetical protein
MRAPHKIANPPFGDIMARNVRRALANRAAIREG